MTDGVPGSITRAQILGGVLALVLASAGYALAAQGRFHGGADAPYYILAAKAWAGGHGFRAGNPTQTKFPPGFSLALAACQLVFGGSYAAFSRFTGAIFPLALLATFVFIRRRAGLSPAIWITGAETLSYACFEVATRGVRSEGLFMAASIGFLAWIETAHRTSTVSLPRVLIGALLFVATVLVRSIGVALLVAVAAAAIHLVVFNRQRARAFILTIAAPIFACGAALVSWRLLKGAPPAERYPGELLTLYDYQFWLKDPHQPGLGAASYADILLRVPGNLRQHAAHTTEIFTNLAWVEPSWTSPFTVVPVVLVVAGLLRELRRDLPIAGYYALAYMSLLAVWPYDEGTRFMVPLFPVALLFIISGVGDIRRAWEQNPKLAAQLVCGLAGIELASLAVRRALGGVALGHQALLAAACWIALFVVGARARSARRHDTLTFPKWPVLAFAAAYVLLGVTRMAALARDNRQGESVKNSFQEASEWIAANTDTSAVVMAQRHLDFELTTGRPGAPFPVSDDPNLLLSAIGAWHARFLVVYNVTPADAYYFPLETARVALLQHALHDGLLLRARFGDASVYEIPAPVP